MSAEQETVTEETLAPDLDELLRDLEEEFGPQVQPRHVDGWLVDLQLGDSATRIAAAEALGNSGVSNVEIVKALVAAQVSDPSEEVRQAAVDALRAPVHQEVLQQHPRLRWTAAVEAKEVGQPAARLSGPFPRLSAGGKKSIWTRLDESDNAPKVVLSTLWVLLVLTFLAISFVRWLYESGALGIVLAILLGFLVLIGLGGFVYYQGSKCPECHQPFAAKLVRENAVGLPRKKYRLSVAYRIPWIEAYHLLIVDRIYQCKHCGHKWRATQEIEN